MSAAVAQSEDIDILEQDIQDISPFLLKILLQDKTTGNFIRFACDEYLKYGEAYAADKEIYTNKLKILNTHPQWEERLLLEPLKKQIIKVKIYKFIIESIYQLDDKLLYHIEEYIKLLKKI